MRNLVLLLWNIFCVCCLAAIPRNINAASVVSVESHTEISASVVFGEDPLRFYWKMAGLVLPFGYPLEEHFITTSDGYILRVYRIPHGRNEKMKVSPRKLLGTVKPVVLFVHALLDSSAGFVVNGPNHSLPFSLADAGYDVWMANMRGNTFSRNHTTLDATSKEFWAFSWDEHASIDAPETLQYVLESSKADAVSIVAFSQGTTITMAALSTQPVFAEKVKFAALMGPAAIMHHMTSQPLALMAAFDSDVLFQVLGIQQFMPSEPFLAFLEGTACHVMPWLCLNIFTLLCGYNPDNLDMKRMPKYLEFTPAGTSVQNMAHWAQAARDHSLGPRVRMFDFGTHCGNFPPSLTGKCNQVVYDSMEPPTYPLDSISTPLALFIGGQDRLADPLDVELLKSLLQPGVVVHQQVEDNYEHLDFVWGINAADRVYPNIVHLLNQYNNMGGRG